MWNVRQSENNNKLLNYSKDSFISNLYNQAGWRRTAKGEEAKFFQMETSLKVRPTLIRKGEIFRIFKVVKIHKSLSETSITIELKAMKLVNKFTFCFLHLFWNLRIPKKMFSVETPF